MTGPIPSWLVNRTQLIELDLSRNEFHGLVPQWLNKLMELEFLSLNDNNLDGKVKFDMFFNMEVSPDSK